MRAMSLDLSLDVPRSELELTAHNRLIPKTQERYLSMPEFVMEFGSVKGAQRYGKLDELVRGFIDAMFWADTGNNDDGDLEDVIFEDLAKGAIDKIARDCKSFRNKTVNLLSVAAAISPGCTVYQAGVHFYCTRNHYGIGFWDGSWPAPYGEQLSKIAAEYGEMRPYVGVDNLIYVE